MLVRHLFALILLAYAVGGHLSAHAQEVAVTGHIDLVGPKGKLWRGSQKGDTIVWLTPQGSLALPKKENVPAPVVRLTQKSKSFDPHVLVIPAGTSVEFPNHDPFFHNVFSLFEGKRFDLGLYEAGGTRFVHFERAGISYIFCNIHPEMSAIVIALSTPYYGRTDASGNVTISAVPPGRYVVHIWNERATQEASELTTRELTLSAESNSLGTIRLPIATDPLPQHKNKYGRDYDKAAPTNPIYEQQ